MHLQCKCYAKKCKRYDIDIYSNKDRDKDI